MAANGGGHFHYVEDAGLDLQEAEDVARRATLPPNRVVSEELEMPLKAIPEADDDDIIPHVPQQRAPSNAADAAAKQSDFSFTPFGAAAGHRSPTLMSSGMPGAGGSVDTAAPFEPQHDRPDSPSLLPPSASPGLPPRAPSPGLHSGSGSFVLPANSDPASAAPQRSSSPSLARSGSSSYLNPEPYEAPPPDPFALARDGEDERLPALPAAAAVPTQGSMYRPPSAEAMEYLSATSGSLPLLEAASAQPDALTAVDDAADAVPSTAAVPESAALPTAASDGPAVAEGSPAADGSPKAEGPASAEGSAGAASPVVPKAAAKTRRSVPKLPIPPATPPEDAFVGLPDDVLHGTGDQLQPPTDASSTAAEPAMSVQEEPAARPQDHGQAGNAPEQAPAAAAAEGAQAAKPPAAEAAPPTTNGAPPMSPPAPAAADAQDASFAPQTPEVSQTEALAPSDGRPAPAAEGAGPPAGAHGGADAAEQLQPGAAHVSDARPAVQTPLEYVSRDNQTPYMERKLRNLQAQDWEGSGGLGEDDKPERTRSQKELEEDLQSWKHLDEQPIAASAANAVQAVDVAPLGEDFKVHKSRLEQDVEAARQRERTPQPPSQQHLPSYMRPTANSATRNQAASSPRAQSPAGGSGNGVPPASSLEAVMVRHQSALEAAKANSASTAYDPVKRAPPPSVPGLDELLADTGRIQRAREEAAQRHSELYRPVPKREAPKGPGLDEVLVVGKSQLELEKEASAKEAGAASEGSRPPPGSPADKSRKAREAAAAEHIRRFRPAAPKSQESDSFGGKGLGEVMLKHKSALQRKKEEAEAAGANSPTAPLRTGSRSQMLAQRQGEEWGGRSLAELQRPHKSRLLREQEEWAERSGTKLVSSRKPIVHTRHVTSPGEKPDAPSFMKDTLAAKMKHIDMPEPPPAPGK